MTKLPEVEASLIKSLHAFVSTAGPGNDKGEARPDDPFQGFVSRQFATLVIAAISLAVLTYFLGPLVKGEFTTLLKWALQFVLGAAILARLDAVRKQTLEAAARPKVQATTLAVFVILVGVLVPLKWVPLRFKPERGVSVVVDGRTVVPGARQLLSAYGRHKIVLNHKIGDTTFPDTNVLEPTDVLWAALPFTSNEIPLGVRYPVAYSALPGEDALLVEADLPPLTVRAMQAVTAYEVRKDRTWFSFPLTDTTGATHLMLPAAVYRAVGIQTSRNTECVTPMTIAAPTTTTAAQTETFTIILACDSLAAKQTALGPSPK